MIKVFISQPMRGKTDEEILNERETATRVIHALFPNDDIHIIDSINPDHKSMTPVECLGWSISCLAKADYIYMCDGFYDADGCCVERDVARRYNIPTIFAPGVTNHKNPYNEFCCE